MTQRRTGAGACAFIRNGETPNPDHRRKILAAPTYAQTASNGLSSEHAAGAPEEQLAIVDVETFVSEG